MTKVAGVVLLLYTFLCLSQCEQKFLRTRSFATDASEQNDQSRSSRGRQQKTFLLSPRGFPLTCETSKISHSILVDKLSLRNSKDKSKILEFPGCFDISAEMQFLDTRMFDIAAGGEPKVMAHEIWSWLQAPEESLAIGCNDTEPNGCNGKGNGCYYCDFCERLNSVNEEAKLDSEEALRCPDPSRRRLYNYKETRCVDNWGHLDKNRDGKPDFLQNQEFEAHRDLLKAMQIRNFGSMKLTFRLAMMETEEQKAQMSRERQHYIRTKGRQGGVRAWNQRYRSYWLPIFRIQNLLACATVLFDVQGEIN